MTIPHHPGSSSDAASLKMAAQASRDTTPELALRRALHAMGRRYRVEVRIADLPRRTIDVAFPRQRVAVFVDGCFWHNCPLHGHVPHSNVDWWRTKLDVNARRDADTTAKLEALGWTVVRVWEHESLGDAVRRVTEALDAMER
jgi:DNA mismatch endonuclease (patch repair protein)